MAVLFLVRMRYWDTAETASRLGKMCIRDRYLCVYRLIVDTVFVYHIVHGASNYPVLFKRLLQEELKRED